MACCFPERFHEEGRAFETSWSLAKPFQMRSNRSKRCLLAIVALVEGDGGRLAREVSLGVGSELARAPTNGPAAESLSDTPT